MDVLHIKRLFYNLRQNVYISIWCRTMQNNKTNAACDYTTHQMMALWPTMHLFIETKWASPRHDLWAAVVHSIYLHVVVPIQLQWKLLIHACTLIICMHWYTATSLFPSSKTRLGWTHKKAILLWKNGGKGRQEDYSTSVAYNCIR